MEGVSPSEPLGVLGFLRERLARMSDDQLRAVVSSDDDAPGAWGASGTATVDGSPVFVKRVPLTDVEAGQPFSTRNHFRLPNYYSYGVGSAGFGVWRELAVHTKTTGFPGFVSLLHHRVMPRTAPPGPRPWDDVEYVQYWNGSAAVGRFMAARDAATREVWIILEQVPHVLWTWLDANQANVDSVLAQLFEQITILRTLGVVHFDAHFGNVVTDGETCRLTDFGLAMASDFDLRPAERAFMERHSHYDYGVVLGCLGLMLAAALGEKPTAASLAPHFERTDAFPVSYAPEFIAALTRYRKPILYMVDHFYGMHRQAKRSNYDDALLADLLRDSGVAIA